MKYIGAVILLFVTLMLPVYNIQIEDIHCSCPSLPVSCSCPEADYAYRPLPIALHSVNEIKNGKNEDAFNRGVKIHLGFFLITVLGMVIIPRLNK